MRGLRHDGKDEPKKFFVRSEYFLFIIIASTASAGLRRRKCRSERHQ